MSQKRACKCIKCEKTVPAEQYHPEVGYFYLLSTGWYLTDEPVEFNNLSETVCQSCINQNANDLGF